ncbi:MAG TPA: serine hydrolase domain-containing protein, partial [Chitinophagaceae bacterium]|nr:serine hydrolase domain-containing protein [Chitinophagaceae bacterium]
REKIDSLFKSVYKSAQPGAAILVEQKGRTVYEAAYGVANLQTRERISSSTNFNIGSLTKQFTAMAVLQLAEKKKLSLGDRLNKFFPDMNKKVADVITIQQLLTHSSGIVEHYDLTDTNKIRHAHNADVFTAIKNCDSTYFSPGSNYRYSNTAYCLLALIVAEVSGMSYPAYMKKNIFEPLHMTSTTIWSESERIVNKAMGYEYDSATGSFNRSDADENIFFSTEGDGGIYTSIDDYMKWLRALQTRKVFSEAMIDLARSPHFTVDGQKKLSYGYGWFIQEDGKSRKIYHTGSNGGFRAITYTIPDNGYVIVIFSNRTGVDLQNLIEEINKILRPGL